MGSESDAKPGTKRPKKSKLASLVSGATAGILVSACVQPLDVLRTRMQADVAKGVYLSTLRTLHTVVAEVRGGGGGVAADTPQGLSWRAGLLRLRASGQKPPCGMRDSSQRHLQLPKEKTGLLHPHTARAATAVGHSLQGGIKALWKGTQATVLRLGLGAGLHFFFLESIKPLLERTQPDGRRKMSVAGAAIAGKLQTGGMGLKLIELGARGAKGRQARAQRAAGGAPRATSTNPFLRSTPCTRAPNAGGTARGLAAMAACPITVVKTQMEYTGPGAAQYTSTAHALGSIVRQRGVAGLFSGMGPTLLSQAPFSALYYVFYTSLQVGDGWGPGRAGAGGGGGPQNALAPLGVGHV